MLDKEKNITATVENIGYNIFESLAKTFPVACASDEFFYFPHIQCSDLDWSTWDSFSRETVTDIVSRLVSWENQLKRIDSFQTDLETHIDIALLQKFVCTLREQLSEVRTWESQPTFYLTLACIGLAEALQSENPAAIEERAGSLSIFLDQSIENLNQVPQLFRDLGLEMVSDTRDYLLLIKKILPDLDDALIALDRFEYGLQKITTRKDFYLPDDLLERIFHSHMHCEMSIKNIIHLLDREINDMEQILSRVAKNIVSDQSTYLPFDRLWPEALTRIPSPPGARNGLVDLYKNEVVRLCEHCLEHDLVLPELVSSSPVQVALMPSFLSVIRTASSYSISPKYPISGGNFYILNTSPASKDQQQSDHREYQMLSAHETYPGHHLLDSSRGRLVRSIRRHIEQPLFYEGWACFAEEIMKITKYFSSPADRLLLAKRRLWRAIRGKIDIGLQTGTMDIETAAAYLQKAGISKEQAASSARKYPLNPGYQLCYTVGLRRFLGLFDKYGQDNIQKFVRTILDHGEIRFTDLETVLKNSFTQQK